MKVSELANELGTTSKEILEIIKKNDPSAKLFAATKLTEAQENAGERVAVCEKIRSVSSGSRSGRKDVCVRSSGKERRVF